MQVQISTRPSRRSRAPKVDLKHITQVKSGPNAGKYKAVCPNGRNADGSLKYKVYGPFSDSDGKTSRERAIEARDKHIVNPEPVPVGRLAKDEPMTLREWTEHWLTFVVPMTAGLSVQSKYRRQFDKHILNEVIDGTVLGDIALVDLTTTHLQIWRTQLADKVGTPTLNYCIKRLKTCLGAATLDPKVTGLNVSPAAGKRIVIETEADKEAYIPSLADEALLLAQAGDDYRAPLITVAIQTGLRVSELVALHWKDVEWEGTPREPGARLRLRWHMVSSGSKRGGDALTAFRPGTKASDGRFESVELDPDSVAALRLVHERLLAHKLAAGRDWLAGKPSYIFYAKAKRDKSGAPYIVPERPVDDEALVFPGLDGMPCRTNTLSQWFQRIADKAGLDKSIHKLRHDCGSILISERVPISVVSKHLRHKNIQTTMKEYLHELQDDRRLAADTFAELRTRLRSQALAV